jgi:hypothetical protein
MTVHTISCPSGQAPRGCPRRQAIEGARVLDPRFTLKVYAQATKRRDRLTGPHLKAYDRALEWAQMGTSEPLTVPVFRPETTKTPPSGAFLEHYAAHNPNHVATVPGWAIRLEACPDMRLWEIPEDSLVDGRPMPAFMARKRLAECGICDCEIPDRRAATLTLTHRCNGAVTEALICASCAEMLPGKTLPGRRRRPGRAVASPTSSGPGARGGRR